MLKNCLILGTLLVCLGQINCVLNPKVVCYYENWWVWRNGNCKMTVEDVDNSLCTHFVYAYMGITSSYEVSIPDNWLMVEKHDLTKFSSNKGKGKALIAIGGYSLSNNFASLVSSSSSRSTFVNSVVSFLKAYGFDGVTLDWSKQAWTEDEVSDFASLLESLHSEFSGKYTLGITVAARPTGFKADKVDKYVDFISVQTFDFHGSWELEVGHEAPLDWQISTLREWENSGATTNKLLMTIPLFGHSWTLKDISKTEPGSPASGAGKQGSCSQSPGVLSYNEICDEVVKHNLSPQMDPKENGATYVVDDTQWITFETVVTAKAKANNATTEGYGGVVVQALANEDFKGICGKKYPLLNAINNGLNKDDVHGRTHPPVTHGTDRPPVTPDPHKICHKEGYVVDPKDCHFYHYCVEAIPGIFSDEKRECPNKSDGWDPKDQKCKDRKTLGC